MQIFERMGRLGQLAHQGTYGTPLRLPTRSCYPGAGHWSRRLAQATVARVIAMKVV